MYRDIATLCINRANTLQQAIACMEKNTLGIVLVVDEKGHLQGTLTDGDVRRALLANVEQSVSVGLLLESKTGTEFEKPVTGSIDAGRETYLALMQKHRISHLPLIGSGDAVAGIVTLDDFVMEPLRLQAVIMAGGVGQRLHPLTKETPKPMLPVGDRPLMAIMIEQLQEAGIRRVNVTTHHNQEKIREHFGEGEGFGVDISYVSEERPLGTAGALGLMEQPEETLLVINGDILTRVDIRNMLAFHREQGAALTVAVRQHELQIPYGVVECDGMAVTKFEEKPAYDLLVNAGIYMLEPTVYGYIPNDEPSDMPDLIARLLEAGQAIVSFPIHEYWLDIGSPQEYERAQKDAHRWEDRRSSQKPGAVD